MGLLNTTSSLNGLFNNLKDSIKVGFHDKISHVFWYKICTGYGT
jgi:hypothetical protein